MSNQPSPVVHSQPMLPKTYDPKACEDRIYALWVPGTDHAAIATESVVIKKIQKEEQIKDPRAHYGREKLVAKIAAFVEQSRGQIRSQGRKMGSSCDWPRE